jgi:hypothetical protein
MESTCVETQTFYFMSNEGTFGMAQVIYSNVGYVGIYFQCDFWAENIAVVYGQRANSIPRSLIMVAHRSICGARIRSAIMASTKSKSHSLPTV